MLWMFENKISMKLKTKPKSKKNVDSEAKTE